MSYTTPPQRVQHESPSFRSLSLSLLSFSIPLLPSDSFLPASTLKLLTFLLPLSLSHPLSIFRLPLTEITVACLRPPPLSLPQPLVARRWSFRVCLTLSLSACLAFSLSLSPFSFQPFPLRFLYFPTFTAMLRAFFIPLCSLQNTLPPKVFFKFFKEQILSFFGKFAGF